MQKLYLHLQLRTATLLDGLRRDEDGQGLTEYSLILAFIAIVAVAALTFFGGHVTSLLSTIAGSVP
jgi:Flp pilus assembly pilin Flp